MSRLSLGLPSTVHIGSNEMLSYRVGGACAVTEMRTAFLSHGQCATQL